MEQGNITDPHNNLHDGIGEDGNESGTESVMSISLSSAPQSKRNSAQRPGYIPQGTSFFEYSSSKNEDGGVHLTSKERPSHMDPEIRSETASVTGASNRSKVFDTDVDSSVTHETSRPSTPLDHKDASSQIPYSSGAAAYPPPPIQVPDAISPNRTGKKIRPESLLVESTDGGMILGVALVDFNHLVGPQIEWSEGEVFQDAEINRILPFLALPDGAHMNAEDYSYFHLVPSSPRPRTVFGISCNRQINASTLLVREADVTRSIVQKAVVVVANKPIFGPIRDKLGVVTKAYFAQRDFSEISILSDFHSSLEMTMKSQLTESTFYIGTNLRRLVHTFRHRTLILLKALLAQKKILFYGHPVELLCTYQYSLVSLIPGMSILYNLGIRILISSSGLLQNLEDCGSPPLASRGFNVSRPNSLRTSDRKSLLRYLGLPLDVFGKDAFFQPYLPLQQLDILQDTRSWLCGTTNSIITQYKDADLSVDIENKTLVFNNPAEEKLMTLTAADRAWIDEIVKDVNEGWNDSDPSKPMNMQFKGSEDYIRTKFEEYITSALSTIRYAEFLKKGEKAGIVISDGSPSNAASWQNFHSGWLEDFKKTNAYEVWDRATDPMLFDIVEPRHPGSHKASTISDIGLRLQEGIYELKLEQQFAPTREALSTAFSSGSTSFLKAVDGVRGRWSTSRRASRTSVNSGSTDTSTMSAPVEITKADISVAPSPDSQGSSSLKEFVAPLGAAASQASSRVGTWRLGLGNIISTSASRFSNRGSAQITRLEDGSTKSEKFNNSVTSTNSQTPEQLGNVPLSADRTDESASTTYGTAA